MFDERFDPTKRRGVGEQPGGFSYTKRLGRSALHKDGQHATEAPRHLPSGNVVTGVGRQSRVENPFDLRVMLEYGGDGRSRLAGSGVAKGHGAETAQQEPRIERTKDGSVAPADRFDLLPSIVEDLRNKDAGQYVGMAVVVLGCRVKDDIGTDIERTGRDGWSHGRVDHHSGARRVT